MTMETSCLVRPHPVSAAQRARAAARRNPGPSRAGALAHYRIGVTFLSVFVVLPLVLVFTQAFSKGVGAFLPRCRIRKRCPPSD